MIIPTLVVISWMQFAFIRELVTTMFAYSRFFLNNILGILKNAWLPLFLSFWLGHATLLFWVFIYQKAKLDAKNKWINSPHSHSPYLQWSWFSPSSSSSLKHILTFSSDLPSTAAAATLTRTTEMSFEAMRVFENAKSDRWR